MNTSYTELSNIISSSIEEEPYLNKTTLIPKIRAIISGFGCNLNLINYEKTASPSEYGKVLIALQKKEMENKFWKDKIKALAGDQMDELYNELDLILSTWEKN